MAFGGVATGSMKAQEAPTAISTETTMGRPQRLGHTGEQRHQQGGGGGVGDQLGQEHHEGGQAEQNDEDGHGGERTGEVLRQEGVGPGLLEDGA